VEKNNGLTNYYVYRLAIDPSNSQVVYAGTWGGGVCKSTDGGESWVEKNNGLTNHDVSCLAIDPSNPQVVYAGTYGGGVFKWIPGNIASFTPLYPSNAEITHIMQGGVFTRYYKVKDGAGELLKGATVAYKDANSNDVLTVKTDERGIAALKFHTDGLGTGSYALSPVLSVSKSGITYTLSSTPNFGLEVDPRSYTTNWTLGNGAMGKFGLGAGVGAFVKGESSGGVILSYNKYDQEKGFSDSLGIDRNWAWGIGGGVEAGLGKIKLPLVEAQVLSGEASLMFKAFGELGTYFNSPFNANSSEKMAQVVSLLGGVATALSAGNPMVVSILNALASALAEQYIDEISGGMGISGSGSLGAGLLKINVNKMGGNIGLGGLEGGLEAALTVKEYPLAQECGFALKFSLQSSIDLIGSSKISQSLPLSLSLHLWGLDIVGGEIDLEFVYGEDGDFHRCEITIIPKLLDSSNTVQGVQLIIPKEKIQSFYSEIEKLVNIAQFLINNKEASLSPYDARDILISVLTKIGEMGLPYKRVMFADGTPRSINLGFEVSIGGNTVGLGLSPTFGSYNTYVMEEGVLSWSYGACPLAEYPDDPSVHQPASSLLSLVAEMFSPIGDAIKDVWNTIKEKLGEAYDTVIHIAAKAKETVLGALDLLIPKGTTIGPSASFKINNLNATESDEITVVAGALEEPTVSALSSSVLGPQLTATASNDYQFVVGGFYALQPENGVLSQSATISLSFTSEAIRGRDTSFFKLYRFDPGINAWSILPSTFDPSTFTFTGTTVNLGEFCIGYDVTPPVYSLIGGEESGSSYIYRGEAPQIKVLVDDQGSGVLPSSIQVLLDGSPVSFSFDQFERTISLNYGASLAQGSQSLFVSSADTTGNFSSQGFTILIEQPPSSVSLSVVGANESSVTLQWTPAIPGTYALDHYEVYRAVPAEGIDYTLLASDLPPTALTYVDSQIQYPYDYLYYFVKAVDVNGNYSLSTVVSILPVPPTLPFTLHLQPKWNMISLPFITDPNPSNVFSSLTGTWYLYQWDPINRVYLTKNQITLEPGEGYWLKVSTPQDLVVQGQPYNQDLTLSLSLGWNLVGYPFLSSSSWSSPRIIYNGNLYTLDQAAANNIITPYVYTWNGTSYDNVKSLGSFQPGKGYWFKAKVNCELVFYRP
jgi:hypothetical protein